MPQDQGCIGQAEHPGVYARRGRHGSGAAEGRTEQCPAPGALGQGRTLPDRTRSAPSAQWASRRRPESCCPLGQAAGVAPPARAPCVTRLALDKTSTAHTAPGRAEGSPRPADTAPARGCRSAPLPGRHSPLVAINGTPKSELQREFLLGALGRVGQGLEQL